jgi:hypothetical protein
MLGLSLLLMTSGWATGDEFILAQLASGTRHLVLEPAFAERADERRSSVRRGDAVASSKTAVPLDPHRSPFRFIDVSGTLQLVDDPDGLGTIAITNRQQLAQLFELMRAAPDAHRFVLCDIRFDLPSPDDAALAAVIEHVPRLVVSSHVDSSGELELPLFDVTSGVADYVPNFGDFLKFRLRHEDGHESLPLVMYQHLHPDEPVGGLLALNTFIPDPRIRTHGLQPIPLQDLLLYASVASSPTAVADRYFQDRIVVIGDFKRDVHPTLLGEMPGPLLLVNAYLGLVAGDHRLSLGWLLLMWVGFTVVSFDAFTGILSPASRRRHRLMQLPVLLRRPLLWIFVLPRVRTSSLLARGALLAQQRLSNGRVVLELAVLTLLSYGLFSVHIHVLLLAIYVYALRGLLRGWMHARPTLA